jgi:hypothetical protein
MKHFLCAVALLMLAACGSGSGREFLGKWQNMKSQGHRLEIVRNGEGFIVRETRPSFFTGEIETNNIPATLKGGVLEVRTGLGVSTLVVDKSTDHLITGQAEYRRAD